MDGFTYPRADSNLTIFGEFTCAFLSKGGLNVKKWISIAQSPLLVWSITRKMVPTTGQDSG